VKLIALASLVVMIHVAMRLAGWAEHASAIVGMGDHALEGAAFVGSYLVAVVVAPVLFATGAVVERRRIFPPSFFRARRSEERCPHAKRASSFRFRS
jgi:hypothetical protein